MNQWHFFAYIFAHFDQNFLDAVRQVSTNLTDAVRAPLLAGITVWLAGTMAIELYSPAGNPLLLLVRKLIRAAIIIVAVTAASYSELFGTFLLTTLPNEITAAVAGATTNGPLAPDAFDSLWGSAWAGAVQVWKATSGFSAKGLATIFVTALYVVFSFLAIVVAWIVFMAMHVLLGLCIAIGPLFVCLLLWSYTTRFFDSWLGACLGLVVAQVLMVTLLSLLIKVSSDIVGQISALNGAGGINFNDEFGQLHYLLEGMAVYASISFFAGLVTWLASAIMGGFAANISGLTGAVPNAIGSAASAPGKALSGVSAAPSSLSGGKAAMRSTTPAGKALG